MSSSESKEKLLWDKYGLIQKDEEFSFGPYYSYQFRNTPRHVLFTVSRYKFAQKMISTGKRVLELGCNEGLGCQYLAEFSKSVHGVDFDSGAIQWAKANIANEKIHFSCEDFLRGNYGKYDAVVSYDVIEHIYPENEDKFMKTVVSSILPKGIFIVGTPNITSHEHADPDISGAHVNVYSSERLERMLGKYFHNVFMFGMNDEMIHTGFAPMCQYLMAVCCRSRTGRPGQ